MSGRTRRLPHACEARTRQPHATAVGLPPHAYLPQLRREADHHRTSAGTAPTTDTTTGGWS
ncbi:hypothetical protein RCO28_03200 [Streptomyces sp. LHD-70]|uniref:hypothetical protein n=1 Tax=Streptomyces sp. LHD-70 TaxID=3072140 RepID=UPI00280D7E41|nr:hypothetical protein [Streptomyces sp. LHD-70]MDQ8701499.1 hypothetical protein [Streptomyces sp. LHD-70]